MPKYKINIFIPSFIYIISNLKKCRDNQLLLYYSMSQMSTLPKILLFFCFSVWLLIWKQSIRNIEILHSISMGNSLTFAELNCFHVTFASITGHPSSWPWLPSGGQDKHWWKDTMQGNVPRNCSSSFSSRFPCSNRSSFNHRLQFISMRI